MFKWDELLTSLHIPVNYRMIGIRWTTFDFKLSGRTIPFKEKISMPFFF